MTRNRALITVATVATLLLGACSTTTPADVVEQPEPADLADPAAVSDELAQQALAACVNDAEQVGPDALISTTVAPITSLVAMIAGDAGLRIEGIVPEGTNSHTYEPPPSVAEQLSKSDVVFLNGLMLEEPASELAIANAPGATICEIGTAVLPQSSWAFDFSFPFEGGKPNPHIWTNPPMVLNMLTVIRDVISKVDPENSDTYDENYVKASLLVESLDEAMATATQTIPVRNRKLLTYHDAYAYFALQYDFDVIGAIQPQSFEEPSPQDIAGIIEQVRTEQVPAVFGSEVFPSPVLEQIGKETGARYVDTLRDDDLPGKSGDVEHSWAGLMKQNFITMVEALGGNADALKAVNIDVGLVDNAVYPQ
ncbi:MAG: metal ABC transporter substrate-binding protein [Ilumatobacteraceae bacterium]